MHSARPHAAQSGPYPDHQPHQAESYSTRPIKSSIQTPQASPSLHSCIPDTLAEKVQITDTIHHHSSPKNHIRSNSPITLFNYTPHSITLSIHLSTSRHDHNITTHYQQHPKASTASHPPTRPKTTTPLSPYPTVHYSHAL
jgi:hypothetical protein